MKSIHMLYGDEGCTINVPDAVDILAGQDPPALPDPAAAVLQALADPIGLPSLAKMLADRRPETAAITISDITRPVPNKAFLPPMLEAVNAAGIPDERIVIIIGTGMHRPSTPAEREILVGAEIAARVEVVDHAADKPETLVRVTEGSADQPPVSVCRRFAEADFRIVTGYIEPHFMAGFSGGRKGVCPAMVDLATIQRFHGYKTLSDPLADNGVLDGNPCHAEALRVASAVGVDLLFNVAITRERRIAGVYCGDLVEAHLAGCEEVRDWATAVIDDPYDLVITNGGGYPLDQTFYQTVKGQCTALPALAAGSTLLQISHCGEQLGSGAYTDLLHRWGHDWRGFLAHIAGSDDAELDQWELQMQARVLDRIGIEGLRLVTDGVPVEAQQQIAVTPVLGLGDPPARLQRAVDDYIAANPDARVAAIPEGPYTMLRQGRR